VPRSRIRSAPERPSASDSAQPEEHPPIKRARRERLGNDSGDTYDADNDEADDEALDDGRSEPGDLPGSAYDSSVDDGSGLG
jgi:hypothetical protein